MWGEGGGGGENFEALIPHFRKQIALSLANLFHSIV